MKKFLALLLLFGIVGCNTEEKVPETIIEMTNQLILFKSRLIECDTLESCTTLATELNSFMIEVNHPDNDGQLCLKYAKCYEALIDTTQYGITEEFIDKLMLLTSKLIFPDE